MAKKSILISERERLVLLEVLNTKLNAIRGYYLESESVVRELIEKIEITD